MQVATAPQPARNKPGRPRLAASVTEVSFVLPVSLHVLLCREAVARDVSLACVIREALIQSRRVRGEWR